MKSGIKLALPEHVPMKYVWPAVGFLFALHMLEGSDVVTTLAFIGFIVLSIDAFNACGGLIYPSGAYVFFLATLSVVVGGVAKAALGEPLDSNLLNARQSMLVYLAGGSSVWAAARINAVFRPKRPLLAKLQISENLDQIAIGSLLVGLFGAYLVPEAYRSSFNQGNQFNSLALMLAVYSNTRKSDGEKSSSLLAITVWLGQTILGVFAFSKTGIFTPSFAWAIGAVLGGYRLTVRRALGAGFVALIMSAVLTPVSQVGRIHRGEANQNEIAIDMVMHPLRTREIYAQQQKIIETYHGFHWYDHGQGLLDRLTMFPIDDALIHRTDQGYTMGIFPIVTDAINMIPRYLVGQKIVWRWGNRYAHELGMLAPKDITTGISFSPISDGYHCLRWWGVTAVSFPIYLVMFLVCDSLTGNTRQTFWTTLYILFFSLFAPEGMLNTPFYAISFISFMVIFVAFTSRYILPVIGGLVLPVPRVMGPPLSSAARRPSRAPLLQAPPRTIEEKL